MDDQPRRFVDHQQMFVLEQDFERDILRFVMGRRGLRHRDPERFLAADLERRIANRLAAGFDSTATDQCLQPLARQGWDRIGERAVEAPPRMGGRKAHVDRLKCPHLRHWIWESGP